MIVFQFGAAAAVGLSGVQNANINEVGSRVSDNDEDITNLQTTAATHAPKSTCTKVNWLYLTGRQEGWRGPPLMAKISTPLSRNNTPSGMDLTFVPFLSLAKNFQVKTS